MSNRSGVRVVRRLASAALVFALVAFGAVGVDGCNSSQDEGDRCTAGSTDECASGLSCVQPANCIVTFCCPASSAEKDPNGVCASGCPTDQDSATADVTEDATDATDTAVTDSGADVSDTAAPDSGPTDGPSEAADVADAE